MACCSHDRFPASLPRRLRWIATHPATTQTMRLWLQKEKPESKALVAPADPGGGAWLEFDLHPGQDLRGLIDVAAGTWVEVLRGARRDAGWCVIRVPDGRLLWPAKSAVRHYPDLGADLAASEPTPSARPATATATADGSGREPSLSCLLYLSTNEFLHGVKYRVNAKTLTATILAVGFLSLRDRGCIELHYSGPPNPPEPYLGVKDVAVRPLRRVALPGIPGEILDALRPWREPVVTAADA